MSAPAQEGARGPRWPALAGHALPWLLVVVVYFTAGGYLSLGTNVLIMVLFAVSLDLALGYAGIVTLGHAAFFGFGAYAAGILATTVWADPLFGLAAATALTAAVGFATGVAILHTSGVTLLMLTLAILSLVYEAANQARALTGGDDGLSIAIDPLLGLFNFGLWGRTAYIYTAVVLLAWLAVAWRVVHSPFGRSLDGIRQNPARMRAIGTPVWWRLVAVYTLSAAMAGTAGALSAQATRFVGLTTLSVHISGIVAVMLVLGGTRRIYGAFIGAAIFVVVQDFAAKIDPAYWMFVVGGMLIAVVLFLEGGLISLVDRAHARLMRPSRPKDTGHVG
ncbi:MAG: branched-chain amino acid ABC transporter permease [Alphaproteobacteria bacterium]